MLFKTSAERPLTSSDLQKELERFANESLSRELAVFADRIELSVRNLKTDRFSWASSIKEPLQPSQMKRSPSLSDVLEEYEQLPAITRGSSDTSIIQARQVSYADGGEVGSEDDPADTTTNNKRRISVESQDDHWMHRFRKGYWVGLHQKRPDGSAAWPSSGRQGYMPMVSASGRYADRKSIFGFGDDDLEETGFALTDFVEGSAFNSFVGVMIFLNMLFVGYETDYLARTWAERPPLGFQVAEDTFCVVFVLEILMRLMVYRCAFFCMPDYLWNIFDLLVVGFQIMDVVATFCANLSMPSTTQFRILRLVRMFRMFRVFRAFRVLRYVKELRMLISSIVESFRPLLWMVLLLSVISSMFGIVLTQLVTDHKTATPGLSFEETVPLELYYGTLTRSMLSLYQVISDGIHWKDLLHPLTEFCSPWIQVVFVCYIACTVLAMMNVITGIFVDSVARTAEHSRKRMLVHQMQSLFLEADADNRGFINWEKFSKNLQNPQMLSYLKDIDLDEEDATDLFRLLDVEGSGSISLEGWVSGCLTLTGPAKSLDLATVLRELRLFNKQWQEHADSLDTRLAWVTKRMGKC